METVGIFMYGLIQVFAGDRPKQQDNIRGALAISSKC